MIPWDGEVNRFNDLQEVINWLSMCSAADTVLGQLVDGEVKKGAYGLQLSPVPWVLLLSVFFLLPFLCAHAGLQLSWPVYRPFISHGVLLCSQFRAADLGSSLWESPTSSGEEQLHIGRDRKWCALLKTLKYRILSIADVNLYPSEKWSLSENLHLIWCPWTLLIWSPIFKWSKVGL